MSGLSEPLALGIDHVAVRVPDPEAAATCCERLFGLAIMDRQGGGVLLSSRPRLAVLVPRAELIFLPGDELRLDHVAFAVADEAALTEVVARAAKLGARTRQREECGGSRTVRIDGPGDFSLELYAQRPLVRRAPGEAPFGVVRLGHLTVETPLPTDLAEFLTGLADFRVSDRYGSNFYWFRCNRDHHALACSVGAPGIQHVAFEVESWAEIEQACEQLCRQGNPVEWGPGRHGPGNNIFLYVMTPFGLRFEFFCGLLHIDAETDPDGHDWGADAGIRNANRWGPALPAEFTGVR